MAYMEDLDPAERREGPGPDKCAHMRPLGAAVRRVDGARVAARGLGQMGLFHPPNSPRNWRLSLSPIYRAGNRTREVK